MSQLTWAAVAYQYNFTRVFIPRLENYTRHTTVFNIPVYFCKLPQAVGLSLLLLTSSIT